MTVRNINAIFKLATPQEIQDGVIWYAEAQKVAQQISLDLSVPLHIVVGVIAALSPNNKWKRNIVNARELIKAFTNGDYMESVKVSTYHTMRLKAWHILQANGSSEQVVKALNGQKIIAFYHCIMGENTCCVDGHARNIFYGERIGLTNNKTSIGKKEYTTIASAYTRAAIIQSKKHNRSFKAYEIQAITWVTWRRIHGIK
jgi:hypothetical protein